MPPSIKSAEKQKSLSNKVTINKRFVDSVSKPGLYLDASLAGFRLKVTEVGSKIFLVYGKVKGKPVPVKVTLGRYGEMFEDVLSNGKAEIGPLTAERARDKAMRIGAQMRNGEDPNETRRERQDAKKQAAQAENQLEEQEQKVKALTLRKAFNDYIADREERKKIKASTVYVYRCDLQKCLADWLDKPLRDISGKDVESRHKKISNAHPGQADHVMRILRAVFNYAMDESDEAYSVAKKQIISSNPVKQLSKKNHWNELEARSNILKDFHFKAFFQACRDLDHQAASDYFPFLLLTGLRAQEAAQLLWNNVSLKDRTILVTDTKNGRPHTLPLTDRLHDMLKRRWQSRSNEFVFGSSERYQHERLVARCREILSASDDDEMRAEASRFKFIVHDLRRTFTTVAARLLPAYVVKQLVNHVDSSDVTATHYIHNDIEMLRKPLQEVNDYILRIANVDGVEKPSTSSRAKVVSLKKHRKMSTR